MNYDSSVSQKPASFSREVIHIPFVFISLDEDDIIRRYESGESPSEIAFDFGVSAQTIRRRVAKHRALRDRKAAARVRFTRPDALEQARAANRLAVLACTNDVPTHMLIAMYESGMSCGRIGAEVGMTGAGVRARLRTTDIHLRGLNESQFLIGKRTPDQLPDRAAVAVGKETRQSGITEDEKILAGLLQERGFKPVHQKACGPYNIDLLVAPLAIEVHRHGGYPIGWRNNDRRLEHLLDSYPVAYVWITRGRPLSGAAADQLVSFYERVSSHPPDIANEYAVFGGNGQDCTRPS